MTYLPNATVYDARLSWPALGILVALLSRPEEAGHGYRDLGGRGLGEKAVRVALKELDAAGYRHQVRLRSVSPTGRGGVGRFITLTLISEDPIDEKTAAKWFQENKDRWLTRAAASAARYDQRKQGKPAGRTVKHLPRSGIPRSGSERHLSTESHGEESLRSPHREIVQGDDRPQATGSPPAQRVPETVEVCEHDVPVGVNASGAIRCPQCRQRAELATGQSP